MFLKAEKSNLCELRVPRASSDRRPGQQCQHAGMHPAGGFGCSSQAGKVAGRPSDSQTNSAFRSSPCAAQASGSGPELHIVAVCSRGCCSWTTEGNRLATLKGSDPVDAPPSDDCSSSSFAGVGKELLIFAERKLVPAAEVEYVADIEIGQTPIKTGTKTRYVRRTVPGDTAAIQQVAGIGKRLGPGVGDKELQPVRELLFKLGLQAVVVAASDGLLVTRTMPEIRKWRTCSPPPISLQYSRRQARLQSRYCCQDLSEDGWPSVNT